MAEKTFKVESINTLLTNFVSTDGDEIRVNINNVDIPLADFAKLARGVKVILDVYTWAAWPVKFVKIVEEEDEVDD